MFPLMKLLICGEIVFNYENRQLHEDTTYVNGEIIN